MDLKKLFETQTKENFKTFDVNLKGDKVTVKENKEVINQLIDLNKGMNGKEGK